MLWTWIVMEQILLGRASEPDCGCTVTAGSGVCTEELNETMGEDGNLSIYLCTEWAAKTLTLDSISPNATSVSLFAGRSDCMWVLDPTRLASTTCQLLTVDLPNVTFLDGNLSIKEVVFNSPTAGVALQATNVTVCDFATAQGLMKYNDVIQYLTLRGCSIVHVSNDQILTSVSHSNDTLVEIASEMGQKGLFLEMDAETQEIHIQGRSDRIIGFGVDTVNISVNWSWPDPLNVSAHGGIVSITVIGGSPESVGELDLVFHGHGTLTVRPDSGYLLLRGTYTLDGDFEITDHDNVTISLDSCNIEGVSKLHCGNGHGAIKTMSVNGEIDVSGFSYFGVINIEAPNACSILSDGLVKPLEVGTMNVKLDPTVIEDIRGYYAFCFRLIAANGIAHLGPINVELVQHAKTVDHHYELGSIVFSSEAAQSSQFQSEYEKLKELVTSGIVLDREFSPVFNYDNDTCYIEFARKAPYITGVTVLLVITALVDAAAIVVVFVCLARIQEFLLK